MKHKKPEVKVFGVEPVLADDAKKSLQAKKLIPNEKYPKTLCDGLRTSMNQKTFDHMIKYVDDVILVTDEETKKAMEFLLTRMKICVEPSAAIAAAVVMNEALNEKYLKECNNIVVILTGGNFDYFTPFLKATSSSTT